MRLGIAAGALAPALRRAVANNEHRALVVGVHRTLALCVVAACAAPASSPAKVAAATSCAEEPEFTFIAKSHAHVWRLLCPNGDFAKAGTIGSGRQNGCWVDVFEILCDGKRSGSITFTQGAADPSAPQGFTLLDPEALAEYRLASKAMGSDWSTAEQHIDAAIAKAPSAATFHRTRGIIFAAQQRYADSEPAFAQAVALSQGRNPMFLLEQATVFMAQRKKAEAKKALSDAAALTDERWEHYGELRCRQGFVADEGQEKLFKEACAVGYKQCCGDNKVEK